MRLTIATKRIGNVWEGALVAEGKFQRALVGEKLEDAVLRGLVGLLALDLPEGTDVVFDIVTETPEEADRARFAREAGDGQGQAK